MTIFLDTHAAVFLWEGRLEVFGEAAISALEQAELRVSPIVRLELRSLFEIGRLKVDADTILGGLEADCGVLVADDSFLEVISLAMALSWTRDPFDRMIVANSLLHSASLITRDRNIRENFSDTLW